MQGVFSIPLGAGVNKAPSATLRGKPPRPSVLDEFIAGPENRLAAVAVKAVFEDQATRVTPLVFYGPSGCGKTHLARGLAEWWEKHHPIAYVVALTGAEFAQQYANAVEHDRIDPWRAKLRTAQMLVIDDLAGITGKRGAQQELQQALDELSAKDAIVIVTTQSLPHALSGLSETLRSRLSGGLTVPVNIPGAATRQAIVERFAAARGMPFSKRLVQSLVENLNVPAPVLLGALMELELAMHTDGKPLDAERIRRYLVDHDREKTPVSIRDIATVTAKYFNLKLVDLKSPSRRKAIVSARNTAVFLARQLTDRSLEQIGDYFGGRDHTTILHGYRQADKLARTDPVTKQAIIELKRLVAIQ